jgi:P2 family phage contractile tail tube protein
MARLFSFENAVLYLDGTNVLGQINEIELPEVEWATIEHETIGLIGTPEFPRRLEPMEVTITPMQYSPLVAQLSADPFTARDFQLRANIAEYLADTKIGDRLLLVEFRGKFSMRAGGTFGSEEMETEYTVKATYYHEVFDGQDLVEIDVNVPSYTAGGTDILAQLRANVGL